jgi:hypothetical protein
MTKFKRQVQDGAPYIVITKAENTLPPINLLNQDPEVMAAGGWNKLVAQSGGPWYGAAYAAIKRVRLNNNVRAFFYHSKVYDVRYTTPVDPSHDPFMEIPNLINNLSGEINMAARALLDKENLENGESNVDYGKKKEGITNNEELTAFKDFVLKKCKIAKVNVPLVGSDEDIVSNAVYAYAYAKAESLNKLHPKAKEAFANAVCYAIAATFNINSNRSAHSARFFNNLSPEDSKELAMDSFETYKALANFSLRESIGGAPHIMNFDEYAELLMNASNNKRNVKSKFDDMMSRMDTVK